MWVSFLPGGNIGRFHRRYHGSGKLCAQAALAWAWLRVADFGPRFAPKNPQLGHAQVTPACFSMRLVHQQRRAQC
jgi:hypothetical protein